MRGSSLVNHALSSYLGALTVLVFRFRLHHAPQLGRIRNAFQEIFCKISCDDGGVREFLTSSCKEIVEFLPQRSVRLLFLRDLRVVVTVQALYDEMMQLKGNILHLGGRPLDC